MPIQVTWHDEPKSIVRTAFVGNWTMKQYRTAWNRCYELLVEQSNHRVDFIIDVREIVLIPPDFVKQFRALRFNYAPNTGLILVVGADEHLQVLIEHIVKALLSPLGMVFVDSLEEAETFIHMNREEPLPLSA